MGTVKRQRNEEQEKSENGAVIRMSEERSTPASHGADGITTSLEEKRERAYGRRSQQRHTHTKRNGLNISSYNNESEKQHRVILSF